MLLPPPSAGLRSRPATYRLFLRHLRHIPDPHVWHTAVPRIRKLLTTPGPSPSPPPQDDQARGTWEGIRQWRAQRAMKRACKELSQLRAAVACHPHALLRLLEKSYYQRGACRWDRLRSILSESNPSSPPLNTLSTPIPPPLRPLLPRPPGPPDPIVRARATLPEWRRERKKAELHERNWNLLKAPVYLPDTRPGMGQGNQVERSKVDNMRILAGLADGPLSTRALPRHLARIIPKSLDPSSRRKLPVEPYPPPRPSHTRQNPSTWKLPREFTTRLRERTYRRVWDGLPWVRPVAEGGEKWRLCTWAEVQAWEQGVAQETPAAGPVCKGKDTGRRAKKAAKAHQAQEGKELDPNKWPRATEMDRQWLARAFG
ncbi:hypothetical protein IAR50_003951 [Cryptococcus sp. DSM 104548]